MKLRAAAAVAVLGVVLPLAATTSASAGVTGDVSGPVVSAAEHVDGAPIAWNDVAAGGARLAVVEATEGADYRNPWFTTDYAGARAAGLIRGSFAVGRPAAPVVTTARQQADLYANRIGASMAASRTLAPVLELTTTGGLNRAQLVTWAQTFLLRLHDRTGRVPVLRTFPYLWDTALDDAAAFARYPLWTANNGDAAPPGTALSESAAAAAVRGIADRVPVATVTADDVTWSFLRDGRVVSPWPQTPPGPPQQVQTRAWDGAVTVGWLPGDTGSSDVTAYHVTTWPDGTTVDVPGDATETTIAGLVDGSSYTFTVTAENAAGVGVASDPTGPAVPAATDGAQPLATAVAQRSLWTNNCGPSRGLVGGTRWKRARPAPGVVLQEGQRRDALGIVRMHVLRVDVTNPALRFAPLMRNVADRQVLSSFRHQGKLVAGTNAGYFDLRSGAASGPVVIDGRARFGPAVPSQVVGIGSDGLMQTGGVAASGIVAGPGNTLPLAGWNAATLAEGVNVYSARWGSHPVPMPRGAVSRVVQGGLVVSGVGRSTTAPSRGFLLVAQGAVAVGWLRSLVLGDHVSVQVSTSATKLQPLRLGYGVGRRLVHAGIAGIRMTCKRTERLPARTVIGWTQDRRQLLLVAVDRYSPLHLHGVEPDQMAQIMRDLGAYEAYMFDGGGSTEMVVRPRPGARLTIRNHPTDGRERRIPVGFGIYRR